MAAILHQAPFAFEPASPLAAVASLLRAVRLNELAKSSIEAKPPAPVGTPLETPRLVIRPLHAGDRREFERVMVESKQHLARFCPLSKGDEHNLCDGALFARHLELCQAGDRTQRAWRRMLFSKNGRLIGAINLNDISRGLEHCAELVVWLSHEAVGQGLAGEALKAVLKLAFADAPEGLGLHKVIALVSPDNLACRRALRRAGFDPGLGEPQVELTINDAPVLHDQWVMYAPCSASPAVTEAQGDRPLTRGLWSMVSVEASATQLTHER